MYFVGLKMRTFFAVVISTAMIAVPWSRSVAVEIWTAMLPLSLGHLDKLYFKVT